MSRLIDPELPATTPEAEPTAGSVAVPVWIMILLGVLVYWGQLYLDRYAGGFNPRVYQPYGSFRIVQDLQPKSEGDFLMARGLLVFKANCEICHQSHGRGDAGRGFPPLAGSDWVLTEGPNRKIRLVLNGLGGPITVLGQPYNGAMPAFRDILNDEDVAAVLTYVRGNKEWGNTAGPVSPEQVKAIRAATTDRASTWTADELLAIPVKD